MFQEMHLHAIILRNRGILMNQKIKIQTEGTPNPNALKFVLDKVLVQTGSYNFPDKEKCENSPLAKRLFEISSVKEILISKNFITVTKEQNTNWDNIYNSVVEAINKHFEANEEIILKTEQANSNGEMSDIVKKIHEILDNQIRPAVASDGGDIIFDSYEDGIVKLHLQGACSSCPSSIMTLKAGVESMLKRAIPEIKEVVSV